MLNLRQIDSKFLLSGGWVDVPKDTAWLEQVGIKAVLDLQFTKDAFNFRSQSKYIENECLSHHIDYVAIPLDDGPNEDVERVFGQAYETLYEWENLYTGKGDHILIKCGVGVSRSPAVLTYYYCKRDKISFVEARERFKFSDYMNSNAGLPISMAYFFEKFLKERFPDADEWRG